MYKVGNIVKIRRKKDIQCEYFPGVLCDIDEGAGMNYVVLDRFAGKEVTITYCVGRYRTDSQYCIQSCPWAFSECYFESVVINNDR